MASVLDLNDIRIFVEVVRAQSFTGAGRALGIPRSSVSRRIGELERDLGARLLHRTTRRVRLTDVGASFHEACVRGMDAIAEAERRVHASQEVPSGKLRVTAPNDMGPYLASFLTAFVERHPLVTVEVELSQRMVDLVGEGFDVAIRATSRLRDSSLVARRLGGGEGMLYASPGYLAKQGTPECLADLADHTCITLGSHAWRLQDDQGAEHTVAVSPTIDTNDPAFTRALLVAHAGIGFLPAFMAAPFVEAGQLRRVLAPLYSASSGLYIVYPSAKHLSATVRAFRDELLESNVTQAWATHAGRSPAVRDSSRSG